MNQRFSIARVFSQLGRMIAAQWAGLLIVIVVFSVGRWALNACLEVSNFWELLEEPISRNVLMSTLHAAICAVFTGALLHVALMGVDWRERLGLLAPFRTMVARFAAIFAALLLIASPGTTSAVLTALMFARAGPEPLTVLALRATQYGLIANLTGLVFTTLVGSAPAIAINERLGPAAAMLRSVKLMRKRGALLFAINFLVSVPVALLTVLSTMLLSGVFSGHPVRLTTFGHPLRSLATLGISFTALALMTMVAATIYLELRRISDAGAVSPPSALS